MKKSNKKKTLTRREFIRNVTGIALTPTLLNLNIGNASALENIGKVVIATGESLTNGISVDADVANLLLNTAIKSFTDKDTEVEAWKSIFPSLAKDDVVGIKINTLFRLCTHQEVVDAIIKNLVAIGVSENNIIIWDKSDSDLRRAGYQINRSGAGVRCFGTEADYDDKIYKIGGQSRRLSKILTQTCNHLINVPVLKDHSISGVTFSMKNHYGSVDNPGALHGNNCDPYIADLNNTDPIKEKTRLIVMDASFGIYVGGPDGGPQFQYNSLILGQDPVALDYQCLQIINAERQKHGVQAVPNATHIRTAENLGLGTMNPDEMKVIQLNVQDVESEGKRPSTWGEMKRMKAEG
jgi:uncharacterized protein (DUF362 family)